MAKMPPEFSLRFGWHTSHLASKPTLWWHYRAITLGPDTRLVLCGHFTASQLRPPPPAPPHKGEGSSPSLGRGCATMATGSRRDGRERAELVAVALVEAELLDDAHALGQGLAVEIGQRLAQVTRRQAKRLHQRLHRHRVDGGIGE